MPKLTVLLILIFFGCSSNNINDKNIEIVIEFAQSYKYDLHKEVYTVFYINKPPDEIKFHLSDNEKRKIIGKYYDLDINKISGKDKITGNTYIEDKCMIMPKLFTIIHVKGKDKLQEIQIDVGCDDFYLSNFSKAKRIKKFLQFVDGIVKSKPQIKNAPTSNIMYM